MRITDIHVDGFGVWNELSVDDMPEGVTLFFGRNEAGKTTLMQFIRATLYGFSTKRRRQYLPPVYGGVPGGLLRVENHSGQFTVERRVSDRDEQSLGRVVVLASNGSRQGQHLLNVLLAGVDESIFQNVFAIGIRELQELATLNDTQASELLYNLASGVDRVSLVEVMRGLEAEQRAILPPEGESGEIEELLQQQAQLAAEVADLQAETRVWTDLAAERVALVTELDQLEQTLGRLEHDSRTLEIAIRVRDRWFQRVDFQRQRQQCGQVDPLPENCLERLETIDRRIAEQREQLAPAKQRRLEIRRELAAQPINRALWDLSCRIEAMCEHGPWIDSLGSEIGRLKEEIDASEMELMQHEEKLVADGGVALSEAPVVTSAMVRQLQPAAVTYREAMKKREIARKQQKQTRQEEEQAKEELQSELAGRDVTDLDDALDKAGQLVNQLRRRVKLDDRLDQMERQEEELREEYNDLLDNQVQRTRVLIAIGFLFVAGCVAVLTGIFGWQMMPMPTDLSWGLSILGLFCIVMSSVWKVGAERSVQEEIDTCLHRRDVLERDIEQAIEDRAELDRLLPNGPGDFAARLSAAERELKELENMTPVHQDRLEARQRIKDSKRHNSTVLQDALEARKRWRRALRQCGLPESFSAKQIRQLGAHHQKKSRFQEQLARKRERLDSLTADRAALLERLQMLYEEVGIGNVSEEPQIQLSQLAAALAGQKELVEQRRALQKDEKEIRAELAAGLRVLRRLKRSREALLAEARVTDDEELFQRAQTLEHVASLEENIELRSEQILGIMGTHCNDEEIEQALAQHSLEHLQAERENLLVRLRDCQGHKGQLHQRRGEINQEMKSLAENHRLTTAKFELECVRNQLDAALRRWRVAGVTWQMLEQIRESYEAERQPETLEEASLYLEQLTGGKYARVWTPLGRNELRVDDQEGHALPLEVLSRGTREAVFLALRMALVASYGRRGVNIPLVLDDVLVNLDAQRARAAIGALCHFAQDGRQMLFFTCHEHIREMFKEASVDIRVLPGHGIPGIRVKPSEEFAEEMEAEGVDAEEADEEPVLEVNAEEEVEELVEVEFDDTDEEEETVAGEDEPVAEEETTEFELEEGAVELGDEFDAETNLPTDYILQEAESGEQPDYSLQAAAERTAGQFIVDLDTYDTESQEPSIPVAEPLNREEVVAEVNDEADDATEEDTTEPFDTAESEMEEDHAEMELGDQVDQVFGDLLDEVDVGEGPWWDPEGEYWFREEETAA